MPRATKLPPPILRIESLSTGREMRPESFVDDFTGEALPMVQDDSPVRPPMDANEFDRARHRAKAEAQAEILRKAGIIKSEPEPRLVTPTIPGMRPVAQLESRGKALAVYMPANPLRRGY